MFNSRGRACGKRQRSRVRVRQGLAVAWHGTTGGCAGRPCNSTRSSSVPARVEGGHLQRDASAR
eukprot:10678433-Karenia_brevis.AAC.1